MTITTQNLGKRFNREWIFKKLSYNFQPGVYAVIGPNGSGKSTLLQVLWGQLPYSTGSVDYMEGHNAIAADDVYQHLTIAAPYLDLTEELTLRFRRQCAAYGSIDRALHEIPIGRGVDGGCEDRVVNCDEVGRP